MKYNCTSNPVDANDTDNDSDLDFFSVDEVEAGNTAVIINFTDTMDVNYICLTPEDALAFAAEIEAKAQEVA